MAETKHMVVTREGLQKMKEELEYKETTEKMRIAEQLKVAIPYENAVVVDESKIDKDTVGFGTRVTIIDLDDEDGEEEEYTIVGTSESDPVNGRLSNESPVGAALIGAHVGETVVAQTPGGNRRLRIVSIGL